MQWYRWRRRTSFPAWVCRRCSSWPALGAATSCRRRSSTRMTTRSSRVGPSTPEREERRKTNSTATTPRLSCTPLSRPPPIGSSPTAPPNRPTTRRGPARWIGPAHPCRRHTPEVVVRFRVQAIHSPGSRPRQRSAWWKASLSADLPDRQASHPTVWGIYRLNRLSVFGSQGRPRACPSG